MGIGSLSRAVFLDRDGVLNPNVLNPQNGKFESPYHPDDFQLFPDTIGSLKRLQDDGYLLFVVSNQPSYAKGITSIENLHALAAKLSGLMSAANIRFTKYYYCYHHPDGIVPSFSGPCPCRKPSPFFLHEAEKNYSVDLANSWMLGDRYTDIQCGKAAGSQTILVNPDIPYNKGKEILPDYIVANLTEATDIILFGKAGHS